MKKKNYLPLMAAGSFLLLGALSQAMLSSPQDKSGITSSPADFEQALADLGAYNFPAQNQATIPAPLAQSTTISPVFGAQKRAEMVAEVITGQLQKMNQASSENGNAAVLAGLKKAQKQNPSLTGSLKGYTFKTLLDNGSKALKSADDQTVEQ